MEHCCGTLSYKHYAALRMPFYGLLIEREKTNPLHQLGISVGARKDWSCCGVKAVNVRKLTLHDAQWWAGVWCS